MGMSTAGLTSFFSAITSFRGRVNGQRSKVVNGAKRVRPRATEEHSLAAIIASLPEIARRFLTRFKIDPSYKGRIPRSAARLSEGSAFQVPIVSRLAKNRPPGFPGGRFRRG